MLTNELIVMEAEMRLRAGLILDPDILQKVASIACEEKEDALRMRAASIEECRYGRDK